MANFKEGTPLDLTGIEAINNLDSARLALRWALERIHALEKSTSEFREKAEFERTARERAEEDSRALNRKVSLHFDFGAERQAYFRRMQEFISLRLSGRPDDKAQALRELELAKQQESFQQQRVDLEREYAAKKGALESEFHQIRIALQQEMHLQTQKREQELLERQASLENQYRLQRERLTRELQNQQKTVEAEVGSRMEDEQRRLATKEAAWKREKESNLREITGLQQRLSAAETAARLAQSAADKQLVLHDADKRAWENQEIILERIVEAWRSKVAELSGKAAELTPQLEAAKDEAQRHEMQKRIWGNDLLVVNANAEAWRGKAEEYSAKAAEALQQLAAAQNAAREAVQEKVLESNQRAMAEERERRLREELQAALTTWETKQKSLTDALDQRRADLGSMEAALAERFKELQNESHTRDEAWMRREETLRERDRQWHEDLRKWKLQLEDRQARLEDLKTELSRAIQQYSTRRPSDGPPPQKASD